MNADAPKDDGKKHNLSYEIVNAEKQLWALIHSKGLLDKDVQSLYRKIRSGYENIILNDSEMVGLQDIEYSLWKFHYKHIDEFRRKIRQYSSIADTTKAATPQNVINVQSSIDNYMEGFKAFLFEATEFYMSLIAKIGRSMCAETDPLLSPAEKAKFHKSQYACHRFLICLGDLSRYTELCKKPDLRNHNWSVATRYYLEAARTWPYSGNPHNQLALLATYIGDDLLALYHCFRSLSVEDPFPDAWDNLLLLFEKNRSSQLGLISLGDNFDFLNPFKSISELGKSHQNNGPSNKTMEDSTQLVSSCKSDFGPLFVRMISFFFMKSSLENFPCTFASTMRELEALMVLDDAKLRASLDSSQDVDSIRTAPFRALQLVSILIFVIHRLVKSPGMKSELGNDLERFALARMALSAAFICMGLFSQRSVRGNCRDSCSLLPAVLVFVEWLIGMLDEIDSYIADDEVTSSISYFFGLFVDLLNRLTTKDINFSSSDHDGLWEDYELRGFDPISSSHMSLDFKANPERMEDFESGNLTRIYRVFNAAFQMVKSSSYSAKWMTYDELGKKFSVADESNFANPSKIVVKCCSDIETNEAHRDNSEILKKDEKDVPREDQKHLAVKGKSIGMEEEEVILFKPITRYNSAPLYTDITAKAQVSVSNADDSAEPDDEFLRRSFSLFVPQTEAQNGPFSLCPDIVNVGHHKTQKLQEPFFKDTAYVAGPPSLSAWVIEGGTSNIGADKGKRNFMKHELLSPIDELASASLNDLNINKTTEIPVSPKHTSPVLHNSPSPYVVPVPSAPLLPDDAVWFRSNSSSFAESKTVTGITEADGILGASPISRYSNRSTGLPGVSALANGYPPPLLGLSSAEWLLQYRNNFNERANSYLWPSHINTPGNMGNTNVLEATPRFDLFDLWGNPLVSNRMLYAENPQLVPGSPLAYAADEQRMDRPYLGYQKPLPYPYPYGCGTGTELRTEQPQLLQYLKDREWHLYRESQVRGRAYMGS